MSRNENRWHGLQGRLVLEGGEKLVGKLLLIPDLNDPSDDGNADHTSEMWMAPLTVGVDGGTITVNMSDAQSRFNINLLALPKVLPTDPIEAKRCENAGPEVFECFYSEAQRRFIRLLQTLVLNEEPLAPEKAKEITQSIMDWLDPDSTVTDVGGAEQSYYSGLEVPVVISNAPMTTISELSLVKGVTPEIYDKLLPYVIALPANGNMAAFININTMPDIMFRMFNARDIETPLDEEVGAAVARIRNDKVALVNEGLQGGFQSVDDFVNEALVSEAQVFTSAQDFDNAQLTINTKYFIYSAEVIIGDKTRRGKSLLLRDQGKVTTLWRTDANF